MRALYTAATGMAAQQTKLDTIANNLANVSTAGFKKSREAFEDLFYQEMTHGGLGASTARVEVGGGVKLAGIERDHRAGSITQDGNPLHVAIAGEGYFALESPDGLPVYTRDGSFHLDGEGVITASNGLRVAGDITVPVEAQALVIGSDGSVSALMPGDTEYTTLGQLEVARFVNPSGMRALGGNAFAETPESGEAQQVELGVDGQVQQGFLEGSNVDVAEELVAMIVTQRSYELNSKVIQAADENLRVATGLKR